ncbi:hypothetical protein V6N13_069694 [Hibiscus sabdariffa]
MENKVGFQLAECRFLPHCPCKLHSKFQNDVEMFSISEPYLGLELGIIPKLKRRKYRRNCSFGQSISLGLGSYFLH